jgi:hypothetical protein
MDQFSLPTQGLDWGSTRIGADSVRADREKKTLEGSKEANCKV